jgi:tetratricopeptide (TPR) repeat protein
MDQLKNVILLLLLVFFLLFVSFLPHRCPAAPKKEYLYSTPIASSICESICTLGNSERGIAFHSTHDMNSKLDKAEEMYQRAMVGDKEALGHDHTLMLSTFNNLSLLYADQGRLDKAEEMYE